MSQETIDQVKAELDQVKKELENYKQHCKGLGANSDAAKQMFNDCTNTNLTLRTNLILVQQAHNELAQKNEKLQKELDTVKAQASVLAAKVLELSPPKNDEKIHLVKPEEESVPEQDTSMLAKDASQV